MELLKFFLTIYWICLSIFLFIVFVVQRFMEKMMEENTNLNATDRYFVFKNTSKNSHLRILSLLIIYDIYL